MSLIRLVPFVTLLFAGCGQNNASLEQRLAETEQQVAALQAEVKDLKEKRAWDELTKVWDEIAYLTPGAEGYSTIRYDLGVLTVQLVDVKPYANGSKVTLKFGNTLSSAIDGLKAKIDYGKVDAQGGADNASAKTKEITFSQQIRAGAWTPVSVVLDGIPPAELGFVRVKEVTHTGIRLYK